MEKKIEIRNEEEYQQFLKALPLYRSVFGRAVHFEIGSAVHPERVRDIETALNIKSRKRRIEYIYDRGCDIVDRFNEENGAVCRFSGGRCEDPKHQRYPNGCCCHCYLQTSHGCPTKNLSCKFFFCDHMAKKYRYLSVGDVDLFRLLTPGQRAIVRENVYVTKQTYLRLLWLGSYLLYCMYSVVKPFRMKNF